MADLLGVANDNTIQDVSRFGRPDVLGYQNP
jgi:hypothetical protein